MKAFVSCNRDHYIQKGARHNMAIVVDGIIGAGKTTVAHYLSQVLNIPIYEEMMDDGEQTLVQRMLDRFYGDPNRWSAITQVMFLNNRFKDIRHAESLNKPSIFDRTIYGDEIFARNLLVRGQMEEDEFLVYQSILQGMLTQIQPPELLIYIDVTVDTAMERIRIRDRSTEADMIPRDYMEDLRKNYELWFEEYDLSPKIRLDLNSHGIDENLNLTEEMKQHILTAISPYLLGA